LPRIYNKTKRSGEIHHSVRLSEKSVCRKKNKKISIMSINKNIYNLKLKGKGIIKKPLPYFCTVCVHFGEISPPFIEVRKRVGKGAVNLHPLFLLNHFLRLKYFVKLIFC